MNGKNETLGIKCLIRKQSEGEYGWSVLSFYLIKLFLMLLYGFIDIRTLDHPRCIIHQPNGLCSTCWEGCSIGYAIVV